MTKFRASNSSLLSMFFVIGVLPATGRGQITLPGPGRIATVVGTGAQGYSGDGGLAIYAQLAAPSQVATDALGNLYIADQGNQCIRKVDRSTGLITTVAGNGRQGFGGDGGSPQLASLNTPSSIAVDGIGHLYIADQGNNRIRMVDISKGIIVTVAGNGTAAYSGDRGPAISAALDTPTAVALDAIGDIYIADGKNQRIREVDQKTGIITLVAGNGTAGYSGDYGPAVAAELNRVTAIVVDHNGHLDIAEAGNHRIRQIDLSTGIITTIIGNGSAGYWGDGGLASEAGIDDPTGVAVDPVGALYIADHGNYRLRRIDAHTGAVTTYAGDGTQGAAGEGMESTDTPLNLQGIAVDQEMNVFLANPATGTISAVGSPYGVRMVSGSDSLRATAAVSAAPATGTISAVASPGDVKMDNGSDSLPAPTAVNNANPFGATPDLTEACILYTPTGPTNLPASAGSYTFNYEFSWTGLTYCVQESYSSSQPSWLTFPVPSSQTCTTSNNDTFESCAFPFKVTQNTGAARSGTIRVTFIDGSWEQFPTLQQGAPELLTALINGSGTITSSPAGLSCPGNCSVSFQFGTSVTLTASPSTGYQFTGWSGACSGTGTCSLTMNSAKTVSATFAQIQETLTATISGSGTVISSPSGVSCPGVCTASFSYGTTISLTATPATGFVFSGWSGSCSGTGICQLTMNGSRSTSATFSPNTPTFSVAYNELYTSSNLPSNTVSMGHSIVYAVNVTSINGFSGTVNLATSGLPAGITANLSSASVGVTPSAPGSADLLITAGYGAGASPPPPSTVTITGTSASPSASNYTLFTLTPRAMQYKGDCSVSTSITQLPYPYVPWTGYPSFP